MKLAKYLKRFKSITGALTGTLGVLPLVSELLPRKVADYAFPPLGPYQLFWESASVVLVALIILLVFSVKDSLYVTDHNKRTRALVKLGVVSVLALIGYFIAVQMIVRVLWIPTENKEIAVSVGFRRTVEAQSEFADEGDWTMLEHMGWSEERIQKLWTKDSILISRSLLFAAYLLFLGTLIAAGSFSVLCDVRDNP